MFKQKPSQDSSKNGVFMLYLKMDEFDIKNNSKQDEFRESKCENENLKQWFNNVKNSSLLSNSKVKDNFEDWE